MIKGLNTGIGLQIDGGYTSWPTFYNNSASNSNSLVGQVRYNGSAQCMEVYDGMTWLSMGTAHPTINLSTHVQAVVDWAQKKMAEEARLEKLAQEHPALADALAALRRAQEQVQIVTALVQQ